MKIGNKIKTGIIVGAALLSPFSAQKAYSEIVNKEPTAQYQTIEQSEEFSPLERVTENSTNEIDVHDVMKTFDKDYDKEKKANISAIFVPTVRYSLVTPAGWRTSLDDKLSPSVELEAEVPLNINDFAAIHIGGKFVYDERNLIREKDIFKDIICLKDTSKEVSGKIVFKPIKELEIYPFLAGSYTTTESKHELARVSPNQISLLSIMSFSGDSYEAGLSGVLNKKNGIIAGISIAGEKSKWESNPEELNQYLAFYLNKIDKSDLINGGVKLGVGTTTITDLIANTEYNGNYLLIGANANFKIFRIPSNLEFLLEKSSLVGDDIKLELSSDITDKLGITLTYRRHNSDYEKKTNIGAGVTLSF